MDNQDIKCRVIEEELRSVWPEWQAAIPPPVRPSQSQPKKNGQSGGNKSVIAIVLVCIIVAVALTVLVNQRGGTESSAGVDQGVVAETEGND